MKLSGTLERTLLVTLLGIAFVYIVITLKGFLVPMALGLLFTLALYPPARRIESWGVPRIATNLLLIIVSIVIIGAALGTFSLIFRNFIQDIPNLEQTIPVRLEQVEFFLEDNLGLARGFLSEQLKIDQIIKPSTISAFFTSTTNTFLTATLTIIYTFFFLYYRDKFQMLLRKVIPKSQHKRLAKVLDEMDDVAPRYVLGVIIVVGILAVVNSMGFAIIGVNNPVFFGVVAALINIIPYVGTIFAFGLVALFALLTQTSGIALSVVIMFVFVQFLENNILTPNITASQVSLNPLVAIVGILVGNMIWGIIGMLLVIPFLAMVKIACDNIPSLEPIGFALGSEGTEKHALTFRAAQKRWRRLRGIKD